MVAPDLISQPVKGIVLLNCNVTVQALRLSYILTVGKRIAMSLWGEYSTEIIGAI